MPDAKSDASPIQEQEQEQEQNTFCSEPDKPASEPPVLILPCIGEGPKEFLVVQKDIDEWVESFPGINVRQELLKAKAWLPANPTKRKTHRGMKRFLVGWLCRAQDSARPAVPANGNGHSRIVGKIDRTPPPVKPENMAVLEAARVAGGKQ